MDYLEAMEIAAFDTEKARKLMEAREYVALSESELREPLPAGAPDAGNEGEWTPGGGCVPDWAELICLAFGRKRHADLGHHD